MSPTKNPICARRDIYCSGGFPVCFLFEDKPVFVFLPFKLILKPSRPITDQVAAPLFSDHIGPQKPHWAQAIPVTTLWSNALTQHISWPHDVDLSDRKFWYDGMVFHFTIILFMEGLMVLLDPTILNEFLRSYHWCGWNGQLFFFENGQIGQRLFWKSKKFKKFRNYWRGVTSWSLDDHLGTTWWPLRGHLVNPWVPLG